MSGNVIGYKKAFLAHLTGLLPNIIPVSLLKSPKMSSLDYSHYCPDVVSLSAINVLQNNNLH